MPDNPAAAPGRDDDKLRERRLVFYSKDVDRIDKALSEFVTKSKSKCALLIDKEGHLVTKQGETSSYDTDTISALVAGSFAATKEMAKILGEQEFSVLFHQGQKDNIQLSLVGDRTLLTVIFDDRTTVGMVRLYANETSKKLAVLFEDIKGRSPEKQEGISGDYGEQAKGKLDDFFGS